MMKFTYATACMIVAFMLATTASAFGQNSTQSILLKGHTNNSASCDQCLSPIISSYQQCLAQCPPGEGVAACSAGCGFKEEESAVLCYPPCPLQYALRNGSFYRMYFFSKAGSYIDYRIGWSAYRVVVQGTDFPITVARCTNDDDHLPKTYGDCIVSKDVSNVYVINNPGCYVMWLFGYIYSTSEECHAQ